MNNTAIADKSKARARRRQKRTGRLAGKLQQQINAIGAQFRQQYGRMSPADVLRKKPEEYFDKLSEIPRNAREQAYFGRVMEKGAEIKLKQTPSQLYGTYLSLYPEFHMTYDRFLQSVILDDAMSSVLQPVLSGLGDYLLKTGAGFVTENAPEAIQWLFNKGKGIVSNWFSSKPLSTDMPATTTLKTTSGQGSITEYGQTKNNNRPIYHSVSEYALDHVNSRALASWICPEFYSERFPDGYQADESALTRYVSEFNAVTDANGNVGIYISPESLFATGSVGSFFTANTVNYATNPFNPTTGVYDTTNGIAYRAGPTGIANYARDLKINGCSVVIQPITSMLSNQGMVESIQMLAALDTSFAGLYPVVPQTIMPNYTYYQLNNLTASQRMVWIPAESTDTDFKLLSSNAANGGPPYNHLFYILFTGCNPSTTVARIKITNSFCYHAAAAATPFIDQQVPHPGQATRSTQAALTNIIPKVAVLPYDSAYELAQRISASNSVSSVVQVAQSFGLSPLAPRGNAYSRPVLEVDGGLSDIFAE